MIKPSELDILRMSMEIIFNGSYVFSEANILRFEREGDERLFYLYIFTKDKIPISTAIGRRFYIQLSIGRDFFNLNIVLRSEECIEIEKWDDREILPSGKDYTINEFSIHSF